MRSTPFHEPSALTLTLAKTVAGFPTTDCYLVGVSGGRDSVALLHLLIRLGFHKLVVCHLDHGLRGRVSGADARFVQRLSASLGVLSAIQKTNVKKLAEERHLSIETAARQARHEFFARVARETKHCGAIFLAHHADDQVETFLFNLFRGAGSEGLGAMRLETARRVDAMGDGEKTELRILRPLLGVWRSEIDDYVLAHRLRFREDETNASLENTRSIMRHRILPMLGENFGRDVRPALWRAAEIFAAQSDWLKASLRVETPELSVPELRALPDALQRYAIHQWLKQHAVRDISFELVETIRDLLPVGTKTAKVNLPGARHVRRREKKLFLV